MGDCLTLAGNLLSKSCKEREAVVSTTQVQISESLRLFYAHADLRVAIETREHMLTGILPQEFASNLDTFMHTAVEDLQVCMLFGHGFSLAMVSLWPWFSLVVCRCS
jgi:hypothetical protein